MAGLLFDLAAGFGKAKKTMRERDEKQADDETKRKAEMERIIKQAEIEEQLLGKKLEAQREMTREQINASKEELGIRTQSAQEIANAKAERESKDRQISDSMRIMLSDNASNEARVIASQTLQKANPEMFANINPLEFASTFSEDSIDKLNKRLQDMLVTVSKSKIEASKSVDLDSAKEVVKNLEAIAESIRAAIRAKGGIPIDALAQ